MTLEECLSELGVFNSRYVAVVGKENVSRDVATLCINRGIEVLLYGESRQSIKQRDNVNCFVLKEGKGQNRWSNLKHVSVAIILMCSVDIIEEILFAIKPLSLIVVVGPVTGATKDVDFYSTVHIKNLEIKFLPQLPLDGPRSMGQLS